MSVEGARHNRDRVGVRRILNTTWECRHQGVIRHVTANYGHSLLTQTGSSHLMGRCNQPDADSGRLATSDCARF